MFPKQSKTKGYVMVISMCYLFITFQKQLNTHAMRARSFCSRLSTMVDSTSSSHAWTDTYIRASPPYLSFAGMSILSVRGQRSICLCAFYCKYTVKGEIARGIRLEVRSHALSCVAQPESSPELSLLTGKIHKTPE